MPGFFDKLLRRTDASPVRWRCNPLVIVHAEDGVVLARQADVEYLPDDSAGHSGIVRVTESTPDGWTPTLRFTQRIETMQGLDPRVQQRPGVILMGEDETGEPFTWYVNGEADRYLTKPAQSGRPVELTEDRAAFLVTTPIDRTNFQVQNVRLLHIVRVDGFCPFSGPCQMKISLPERGPVVEHWTSMAKGDDGRWPELFVLNRQPQNGGFAASGVDGQGISCEWYLDGAADAYLQSLEP